MSEQETAIVPGGDNEMARPLPGALAAEIYKQSPWREDTFMALAAHLSAWPPRMRDRLAKLAVQGLGAMSAVAFLRDVRAIARAEAGKQRDRCVTPGCDTPIDPDLWPMLCRDCGAEMDVDLDDHYERHPDPEMVELHHVVVAEEMGYLDDVEDGPR